MGTTTTLVLGPGDGRAGDEGPVSPHGLAPLVADTPPRLAAPNAGASLAADTAIPVSRPRSPASDGMATAVGKASPMPRHAPFRSHLVVAAIVLVTAACGPGGPDGSTASPLDSPTPSASRSASPTPTATVSPTPTAVSSPTPTVSATETEDDQVVLAGQFTAFVGADGAGPACDADVSEAWWASKPPGGLYVGLSDNRDVTAAGRVERLCLLGFDGQVALRVTTPGGDDQVVDVDATRSDGGVGVLEVAGDTAPVTTVMIAAWQPSPGPTVLPTDSPTDSPTEALTDSPTDSPTVSPTDTPSTPDPLDDPTEIQGGGTDPVELDWQVADDARGDYTFVARQGDVEASAVVQVVAPTSLEVGAEAEGVRLVTLHDWPGEPVPVGLYRKQDGTDLEAAHGYRGKPFELVTDLGTIADGQSVEVPVGDLGFGHWCIISPAVTFVDCQADVPGSSGWSQ